MTNETIDPIDAKAVDGFVLLEGRPGVALTMLPECALESASRMRAAAILALGQRAVEPIGEFDDL